MNARYVAAILALLAAVAAPGSVDAGLRPCGALPNSLPANDDGSSAAVPIGFQINFFGARYDTLYVNNNGNVTFSGPLSTYTPFGLVGTSTPIIAPFFADVDTRGAGSVRWGRCNGDPDTFVVEWRNVGYFNSMTDKTNTFQLILDNDFIEPGDTEGDFDIVFNYEQVRWETGSASGGSNGLGGNSARAGYGSGTSRAGSFFEFPGSGDHGALLDSNARTGLVNSHIPENQPRGSYVFLVRDGAISSADLAVAIAMTPKPPLPGRRLRIGTIVKNFGKGPTESARLAIQLPALTVRSMPAECTLAGQALDCPVGRLERNQQRIFLVEMTPGADGPYRARATLTTSRFDPNLQNNKATASSSPDSCSGQTLTRQLPSSLDYASTSQTVRKVVTVSVTNVGVRAIELRGLPAIPGSPFRVVGILPSPPITIDPGETASFGVLTERQGGQPAATASPPYVGLAGGCD